MAENNKKKTKQIVPFTAHPARTTQKQRERAHRHPEKKEKNV
jgi:hypothetical protein